MAVIATLPLVQQRAIRGTSAFLLYYSYASNEKDLIAQLEKIGSVFQYLFGIMGDGEGSGGGVERFEDLFVVESSRMERQRHQKPTVSRSSSSDSQESK